MRYYIVFIIVMKAALGLSGQCDMDSTFSGRTYYPYNTPNGVGITVYDIDQDGRDDITIPVSNDFLVVLHTTENGFEELNPLYFDGSAKHVIYGDVDNDGDDDMFVTFENASNRLFINQGDFVFNDQTEEFGLLTEGRLHHGASFGDVNNDGYLDIVVCVYELTNSVLLFLNNQGESFSNVSQEWGIGVGNGFSFQATFFDHNQDGKQDLHIANDRIPIDGLMINYNGFFINEATGNGFDVEANSMSSSLADFDHDQDFDIYVTHTGESPNFLWEKNSAGFYENTSVENQLDLNRWSWAANWIDWDNDSFEDIFICHYPELNDPLPLFMNMNGEHFTPLSNEPCTALKPAFGCAKGDFNADGFYDLVVANGFTYPVQKIMNTPNGNHFLRLRLEGRISNRNGIGSIITYVANNDTIVHYTRHGDSYMAQDSQWIILGMKEDTTLSYLKVEWLSGVVDEYFNLPLDTSMVLIEGLRQYSVYDENGAVMNEELSFCSNQPTALFSENNQVVVWNNGEVNSHIFPTQSGPYWYTVDEEWGIVNYSDTTNVSVLEPPMPNITIINPLCEDTFGQIVILDTNLNFDPDFSNEELLPGEYSFSAINTEGCSTSVSFSIVQPESLEVEIVRENIFDSTIQVLIQGGTPPYLIQVNGEEVMGEEVLLEAGVNEVEVSDANECSVFLTETLLIKDTPPDEELWLDNLGLDVATTIEELRRLEKYIVQVFDMSGRVIVIESVEDLIDTSKLSRQVLIVQYAIDGKFYFKKLLI
ncbi:MAG: FG-GAP repeat domain-containing protein [Flavobacteriales bacterium]|jgi:hypothetical protein